MYGLVADPDTIDLALTAGSSAVNLRFRAISYDIAPESAAGSVAYDASHAAGVTVSASIGDGIPVGAPAGVVQVYNGITGVNPRGFWVDVVITPTGTPSGYVTVTVSVPGFTDAVATINVAAGGTGADFVLDTFHGVDHTQIALHPADYAPNGTPLGEIVGWRGGAAYADTIESNKLQSAGNSGLVLYGRIWAHRHDYLVVRGIMTPKPSTGEVMALVGRGTKLDGNTDNGWELVWFFTQRSGGNVLLSWDRRHNYGAGWVVDEGEYQFGARPWALGTTKQLIMIFIGAQLFLQIADADGGNPETVRAPVLATPWNDSSHEYVGFAHTMYADCFEMTEFSAMALSPVGAENPGGAWESLGAFAPSPVVPWESLEGITREMVVPWESGLPKWMRTRRAGGSFQKVGPAGGVWRPEPIVPPPGPWVPVPDEE